MLWTFDLFICTLTNDNCFSVCSAKSMAVLLHNQRRFSAVNNENKKQTRVGGMLWTFDIYLNNDNCLCLFCCLCGCVSTAWLEGFFCRSDQASWKPLTNRYSLWRVMTPFITLKLLKNPMLCSRRFL